MKCGINADGPRHPEYSAVQIAEAGLTICRFPLWVGYEQEQLAWYEQLTANGVTPMLVLDRSSFTAHEWRYGAFQRRLDKWWEQYPIPAYVCAGNEVDGSGPESSRMTKLRAKRLVERARYTWPDSTIIAMGLVGIDFSYVEYVPK